MNNDAFLNDVYGIVAAIPSGRVMTYGQIAYLAGRPQCSRLVGNAICHVPSELHLPCHRIVNSVGRLAPSWQEQRTLLLDEGVKFRKNGCVDLKSAQWEFMKES